MQEKYTELMLAKEMDTKIFYKLVNQQRSTATEMLHFEGLLFYRGDCKRFFWSFSEIGNSCQEQRVWWELYQPGHFR